MELRERISAALKEAMKSRKAERLSTLRLINAAIKDRDIEMRVQGPEARVSDEDVLSILARMAKQRQESARAYEEGGRLELAEKELEEIRVIEEFLPRPCSSEEVEKAISLAMEELGASSIRDMGRVMALLKSKYAGRMDFGTVGPMVKARLA